MAELVSTTTNGGVATIVIDNPGRLNALAIAAYPALLEAFRSAERDAAIQAVVLTGAGRAFSAGADITEFEFGHGPDGASTPPAVGQLLRERVNPVILRMRAFPKPLVAAVNGVAAGAGMSLALACDIRYAAQSARFVQAFIGIGLVPDAGSSYFLPRLVGPARALELMLTAEPVGADEAMRLGLVTRILPDDQLLAGAQALAARLAAGPTKAQELVKRMANQALDLSLERALELEAGYQEVASRHSDFEEGVAAFLAKRAPAFGAP